jgi:hypothetical protein
VDARAAFLEIDRHDWASLSCACGKGAGHLAGDLKSLLRAGHPSEVVGVTLDGHVEDCSLLFACAVDVVPVILQALQEDIADFVRGQLMVALCRIALGEVHADEPAAGERDIEGECRAELQRGIAVLYREAAIGDTGTALEILEEVEPDRERLAFHRAALAGRLSKRRRR